MFAALWHGDMLACLAMMSTRSENIQEMSVKKCVLERVSSLTQPLLTDPRFVALSWSRVAVHLLGLFWCFWF